MLNIPTDLDSWNPADVTAWHAGLSDDETVTDAEYAAAERAVHTALLDL